MKLQKNWFYYLYGAVDDQRQLKNRYREFLWQLCKRPLWQSGPVEARRVLWTRENEARRQDEKTFRSPGLYVWGVDKRPLYFGITTKQTFHKRFRRYVSGTRGKRSQCVLARNYSEDLIKRGIDGFPPEIRFKSSTVRLEGAVCFARHGIGRVWFALLPADGKTAIERLEQALVQIAKPPLNKEFKPNE